jgi:hypothetical protein
MRAYEAHEGEHRHARNADKDRIPGSRPISGCNRTSNDKVWPKMKNTIQRNDAIALIVQCEINSLSNLQRENILMDWWSIAESTIGYKKLPSNLRTYIKNNDFPEEPSRAFFDPLIALAPTKKFSHYTNQHLKKKLQELLPQDSTVEGQIDEALLPCRCCGYRTMESYDEYFICPLCKWEDDGTTDGEKYSPSNKDTLGNFRRLFQQKSNNDEAEKWPSA